ncbi:hypothetical protein TREMEDRAFT_61309 [Tremella mesenterica DSM 1558]|uniref:uncharacterized protein n=1 Tax=Tremella mesenterica (strain ATCC 24925 / CBS 8224 / DSM 1558 / NBRC 9311 / NRRL Y-6157 / RJB 2259-6 / UBC 559-6) TaxID=578456 RepID=UPI0003F4A289|nr:uncharacterized protein TREMEDRAFT_61309 [Tremella mesenterica DSM 1558]EIW70802.1 hypothetical protein TREMEDRAFT_61309 [Tremella mesenterica DSM 1558]
MEELLATFAGGMHVGQEGYDLRQLQEYLSQHLPLNENVPLSPSDKYHPLPSRSSSSTRKRASYPPSTLYDDISFDWSSSTSTSFSQVTSHPSTTTWNSNPSTSTSHSLPLPVPAPHVALQPPSSPGYGAFTSDAFAPLWAQGIDDVDHSGILRSASEPPVLASASASGFGNRGGFGFSQMERKDEAKPASEGAHEGWKWKGFTPINPPTRALEPDDGAQMDRTSLGKGKERDERELADMDVDMDLDLDMDAEGEEVDEDDEEPQINGGRYVGQSLQKGQAHLLFGHGQTGDWNRGRRKE